MSKPD